MSYFRSGLTYSKTINLEEMMKKLRFEDLIHNRNN